MDWGKHRAATQNPKGSEIIYKRKAVQMLHLYIIYLQNIIINGRVNNIKNSIKAFLAFTQHLLIEALPYFNAVGKVIKYSNCHNYKQSLKLKA